jgi:hypothetical protein
MAWTIRSQIRLLYSQYSNPPNDILITAQIGQVVVH